jgi:NADH:ubiquinone oxidoreductase subunit 5 (subunit L)/multisubunit Na+/H+ antiporter MnhA subunit
MQRYTVYLYLETALHVWGVTSTHHQERKQLYLQHLVFVTPLLLSADMAAPTSVFALVHSSTLVTASVYLPVRFGRSFGYWLNVILLLVSGLTIFIAGLGANFEFDFKRIISLSTF